VVELLVVSRFRVPDAETDVFRMDAQAALGALAERPGYLDGHVGRNVDEPDLWLLTTAWTNVGSYRRALSAYDVKMHATPLLAQSLDEPSAFEVLAEAGPGGAVTVSASDRFASFE
jgi:quinol monooxygenase YgiN